MNSQGQTLQARNALIGRFTEKWARNIFAPIAKRAGLYAVNGFVCESIGLTKKSSADLALCTTDATCQALGDIKLLFENKMSIVSNYRFDEPFNVYSG